MMLNFWGTLAIVLLFWMLFGLMAIFGDIDVNMPEWRWKLWSFFSLSSVAVMLFAPLWAPLLIYLSNEASEGNIWGLIPL